MYNSLEDLMRSPTLEETNEEVERFEENHRYGSYGSYRKHKNNKKVK